MATQKEMILNIYSNFMKYIFSNVIFNLLLIVLENMPILVIIDFIFGQDVLSQIFSPLYFLSPTTFLDLANERLTNECSTIFNTTGVAKMLNLTTFGQIPTKASTPLNVEFFNKTILTFQTTYCLYSNTLVYFALAAVGLAIILFLVLAFIDTRKNKSVFIKIVTLTSTNLLNLLLRPFAIVIFIILMNKPLNFLYMRSFIQTQYYSNEIAVTFISLIFFLIFFFMVSFYIKYLNNAYYFESFPYDYFSQNDSNWLLYTKIFFSFYINLVKITGVDVIFFVTLLIGIAFTLRGIHTLFDKRYVINNMELKMLVSFFSLFFPLYVLLKIININFTAIQSRFVLTLVSELLLITVLAICYKSKFLTEEDKFIFRDDKDFLKQSLHFMFYVQKNFQHMHQKDKIKTDHFIDNIIIGHKMKCSQKHCILCPEDIYNPDIKTFYLILYQQFLEFEKEMKEKDGEICQVLKILFLKVLDEKKIHRISYHILKISEEVGLDTFLKINYLYRDMLDEVNKDAKNLITIKYSEIYDELYKCILDFEDIITCIKSRTEKVEIVINKTNEIGLSYKNITKDLLFLKNNKRIFFDTYNIQQLLCLIKYVFDREINADLMENLENNFLDFLENIDSIFEENRVFMVRYDFADSIWKIKKVPKVFLEFTKFKASELIDQNVEKIFPHFLGRLIVKRFQELILSSILDSKLNFKTYVCDAHKNVRFVKFEIDVIPNLEDNYILLMDCHFHKRNILIVDEFANLINGCEELYNKVGINSEAIAASRGKLNLYSVFNVAKNIKLEEVKCLYISDQFIQNTAKNVFLVEPENSNLVPRFLSSMMLDEKKKKKNEKIYTQIYEIVIVNDVKYFVYYFTLDDNENKLKAEKTKSHTKHTIIDYRNGTTKNESFTSTINSEKYEDNKKFGSKFTKKTLFDPDDESKKDEINYFDYYNLHYDTNNSASVTLNNHKKNASSSMHSQSMSTNSDLFTFLYFKNLQNKKRSTKFQKFLNLIYIFNFFLTLVSLFIIFFMTSDTTYFNNYLANYRLFNKLRTTMYSATSIYLSMLITNQSETDIYNSYITQNYLNASVTNPVDFDLLVKENLQFQAETILSDLNSFQTNTYNFFGSSIFNADINYEVNSIYFNTIGSYIVKQDSLKVDWDLFTLTSYELSNLQSNKIYLNVSYLDFDFANPNKLANLNISQLTTGDYNYFQRNINIYQYLFNYFSVYDTNLQVISSFFSSFWEDKTNSLDSQSKGLLIGMIILHIIFVLISFSSIVVYKRILLKEFNTLYSINEDHIIKLKDKFRNLKGLIKAEQMPSKIYQELRKLKEAEAVNLEKKKNIKKSVDVNGFGSTVSVATYTKVNSLEEQKSNPEENFYPYLKYSGAKAALVRSSTLMVKDKMEKIKKETKQVQASKMLLQRLNFKFELVNKLVFFIAFMCFFYIATGILIVYILENNITQVQTVFKHSDLIYEKSAKLFNFYIAAKLSTIFNKPSPYTQSNGIYNSSCLNCDIMILEDFNQIKDDITHLESINSILSVFSSFDASLTSQDLCSILYSNNDAFYNYVQNSTNSAILTQITSLCGEIPILQSNVDSVFSYINTAVRRANEDSLIRMGNDQIQERLNIIQYEFIEAEILLTMFAEPYFSYVINTLLVTSTNNVISNYFTFIVIISVINLCIDFIMLTYIWFEIHQKIISSVNNIYLVTDSVSTI